MGRWADAKVREQREQLIVKMFTEGVTVPQIVGRTGMQSSRIYIILRKHGVDVGDTPK